MTSLSGLGCNASTSNFYSRLLCTESLENLDVDIDPEDGVELPVAETVPQNGKRREPLRPLTPERVTVAQDELLMSSPSKKIKILSIVADEEFFEEEEIDSSSSEERVLASGLMRPIEPYFPTIEEDTPFPSPKKVKAMVPNSQIGHVDLDPGSKKQRPQKTDPSSPISPAKLPLRMRLKVLKPVLNGKDRFGDDRWKEPSLENLVRTKRLFQSVSEEFLEEFVKDCDKEKTATSPGKKEQYYQRASQYYKQSCNADSAMEMTQKIINSRLKFD